MFMLIKTNNSCTGYWDAALLSEKPLPSFVPRVDLAAALDRASHNTEHVLPGAVVWNHIIFGSLLPVAVSPFDRGRIEMRGCSGA